MKETSNKYDLSNANKRLCEEIKALNKRLIEKNKQLKKLYEKLIDGTPKDKKDLKKGIEYFKKTFHRNIYTSGGEIKYGEKRTKKYDNQRSLIGKARMSLLNSLKNKLSALHSHLDDYLKMETGLIYDPPENSPIWCIKESPSA